MIYSKRLQRYIPVTIEKKVYDLKNYGSFTKYIVKDGPVSVGYIDLSETKTGVFVEMIKNSCPNMYSGFGKLADQIEVEHCLNKKMDTFEIKSHAALNSHALHYLRGKRFEKVTDRFTKSRLEQIFLTTNVNKIVEDIIKTTKAGEKYVTSMIGSVPMYMPKDLIQKYIDIIKRNPILK